jgi:hypothetical protein
LMILLAMVAVASADPWAARLGEWVALQQRRAVVDAWAEAGLNEGLVSYWAMRTSGTTVIDEYGSNDGTAVNTPTFSEANGVRDDGVLIVPASSHHIIATDPTGFTNSAGTITGWVKPASTLANESAFNLVSLTPNENSTQAGQCRVGLYGVSSSNRLVFVHRFNNVTRLIAYSNGSVSQGNWHHFAVTMDASGLKMYINGVQQSVTYLTGTSTSSFWWDRFAVKWLSTSRKLTDANQLFLDGSQDEIGLWNRALSSNEVYQIYSTPLYAPYKQ